MSGSIIKASIFSRFRAVVTFLAMLAPVIILFLCAVSGPIEGAARRMLLSRGGAERRSSSSIYSQDALPPRAKIGYGPSVVTAMREMGLVLDIFDAWVKKHPGSSIKHIKYMPEPMQRTVARTALFIRKSNRRIDAKTAWREAAAFVHYSAKYGVPSMLSTAVAHAESSFDPDAVSPKGASGVMQVMWKVHNRLLKSNGIYPAPGGNPLADPEYAIAAGCLLLSRYIRAYGSVQAAMDRYYGVRSTAYQRRINKNIASLMTHNAVIFK
jgi:hypothetical protein